jgi:RNA polymerase sigma factor (sigma-70 family)
MLKILATYHSDWIKVAQAYNAKAFAEDIVQEMYIKVIPHLDKCIVKGKPNKAYIYTIIRNLCLDLHRKSVDKVEIIDNLLEDEVKEFDEVDVIDEVLKDVHWYDKQLFQLYLIHNSCRKLEELTGINYMAIHRSIWHVKSKLKNKAKDLETQSKR